MGGPFSDGSGEVSRQESELSRDVLTVTPTRTGFFHLPRAH